MGQHHFSWRIRILGILLPTLLCLICIEFGARCLEGEIPQTKDTPNSRLNRLVLRDDPATMMHLRSNIVVPMSVFWPDCKLILRTNSTGQRMEQELPTSKSPGQLRIATLGDSSTMGWGVDVHETYASQLSKALQGKVVQKEIEVLNFGTVGFSSYTGLQQLQTEVLPLHPDLVILAFGFNDGFFAPGTDEQRHQRSLAQQAQKDAHPLVFASASWLVRHSALYRHLVAWAFPARELLHCPRVPLQDYGKNMATMVQLSQNAGAQVILLNLNLPNTYGADHLRLLARRKGIPLVDARQLFLRRGPVANPSWEERMNLPNSEDCARQLQHRFPQSPGVLFQASVPSGKAGLRVFGRHPILGGIGGEGLELFDDGTHGDPVPQDQVLSRFLNLQDFGSLDYQFRIEGEKLSPEQRQIAGLTSFHFSVRNQGKSHTCTPLQAIWKNPLEDFLIPYDQIHPNARGHALIAQALTAKSRKFWMQAEQP